MSYCSPPLQGEDFTAYRLLRYTLLTYYYIFLVLSRIFLFVTNYRAPCSSDVAYLSYTFQTSGLSYKKTLDFFAKCGYNNIKGYTR